MNRFQIILLSILISAVISSCTERIDLPLDESSVRLVVEGAVTTDTAVHTVYLTKTTSYYYNQKPPVVTGATVNITDGSNVFELNEREPGVYLTSPDFHGIAGKTYNLNIKLLTPLGGFTDYTSSSKMNKLVKLDSVSLDYFPEYGEQGLWEVKCYLEDEPTTDYYRFQLFRNNHLITQKLSRWLVTDDKYFNGSYAVGIVVTFLDQASDNEKIVSGDELSIELNSLNRDFYYFIQDAQSELRGSNPLFSGPGANIKGNISNGALGYFDAYPVSRSGTIAHTK
jgi:hypothetical protein